VIKQLDSKLLLTKKLLTAFGDFNQWSNNRTEIVQLSRHQCKNFDEIFGDFNHWLKIGRSFDKEIIQKSTDSEKCYKTSLS
jgi:hypothetical protein